jgi:hypothetical protein
MANILPPLTKLQEFQIIERWRFSKNNSTLILAAEFKVSPGRIDKVINNHLSKKTFA